MIDDLIKDFTKAGEEIFFTKKAPWPVKDTKGYHES